MSNRVRVLLLSLLSVSLSAQAMTYPKRPGANNPAVDPADRFRFECMPQERNIFIDERAGVFSSKDKKAKRLRTLNANSGAGFYISYLECSVRGEEVIFAYEESNASDTGVVAGRCPLLGGPCKWRVSISVPGAGVPEFHEKVVSLPLGILNVDLSLETGKMSKWKGTGCLTLVRYDDKNQRSVENVGPSCQ